MSRIITVTSGKGGVGKSSISVNLAIALAHQNLKVCLIDGDFGLKNLDVMMGLENRVVYDLNDVISGKCEIHQVLVKDKREQTLYLFGDYYRKDVLENPEGTDHQNIRNFITSGWGGIKFEGTALIEK